MTHLRHFQGLAKYNAWMNVRLFDLAATLADEELSRERGAFFGSIHGTLNHLLLTDRIWLRRFRDAFPRWSSLRDTPLVESFESLRDIVCEVLSDLRREREITDSAIADWVAELSESDLSADFRYSNSKGIVRMHPVWFGMAHLFNHQTHHRGQVTTLFSQIGIDPGMTDFPIVEHL